MRINKINYGKEIVVAPKVLIKFPVMLDYIYYFKNSVSKSSLDYLERLENLSHLVKSDV